MASLTTETSMRLLPMLTVAVLGLLVLSCDKEEAPQDTAKSSDTPQRPDTLLSQDLPPGRFQLPTRITPAPNLWITLPEGYTVKDDGKMPNDRFFILRNDDPSISDRNAVTPGFMQIYVGVSRQSGLDSNQMFRRQSAVLGHYPAEWRLWSEQLPDGRTYYSREITGSDFFSSLSPDLAEVPLHLHIYVAGADSTRVDELMKSAGTLSIVP